MQKYHVSVAAEAYAAAAFARAGYEVSVQYGANQPGYDLVAIKETRRLLVSVKGSQDGGWVLHGCFKKGRTWTEALQKWKEMQNPGIVFFFVQFGRVEFGEMPRMYVVNVDELADHLRRGRAGNVSGCLREQYAYSRGVGAGHTDIIPEFWRCTVERIDGISTSEL